MAQSHHSILFHASPGRWLACAAAAVAITVAAEQAGVAAKQPSDLSAVLSRAGNYVVRFEEHLAAIVAEEHYTQRVEGGRATERRDLRSDLLFVRPVGASRYVQFRDVFEVDGQRVRDPDERLAKLAADPSAFSMAEIVAESAQYNIGNIERTINVPLLPLMFLLPDNQPRFRYTVQAGAQRSPVQDVPPPPHFAVATEIWVVEYRETDRPTLVRSVDRKKDVPAHGRFWIEPASGRVLMSELIAEDRAVHSKIVVSYQSEPILDLLVPIEMRETYWRSNDTIRIEGVATYEKFRRLVRR